MNRFAYLFTCFMALALASCRHTNTPEGLCDVTVSLSGIGFTLEPMQAPARVAAEASASEAGITHISLAVFKAGTTIATLTQKASEAGDDFNSLALQLPAGTYTFVAVAHDATSNSVPCVTITSPTDATLPEGIVPTLYTHVEEVTISSTNSTITLDMGTRINATFHLASTDNVPAGVARMAVGVNPVGTEVSNTTTVSFNPTTGLAIGNWHYKRAIAVTEGLPVNGSFNILLPSDDCTFAVKIEAHDASGTPIADYTHSFDDVPFQRAYVTNANGQFFNYTATTSSLTFDLTQGSLTYEY